jgi:hypothetical protein
MKDVDFLPQRYRRDRAGRSAVLWRSATAAALAGVLACAWLFDVSKRHLLERELAEATRQHDQMMALANECSALQSKLKAVDAEADLWTYLRHPWPKTQILATLAERLPPGLSLDEVRIGRGETMNQPAAGLLRDTIPARSADPAAPDTRTPAQRDLARLQASCDSTPVVALIRGTTIDMAELHGYLAQVGQAPLFSKAELVSLERGSSRDQNRYRFVARLTLCPGYGQPQGPAKPQTVPAIAATANHQTTHSGASDGSQSR